MTSSSITIRVPEKLKQQLISKAEQEGVDLSTYLRTVLENVDRADILRTNESVLHHKMQELAASVAGVSVEDLERIGFEIVAFVPPKVWEKLTSRKDRVMRGFLVRWSESQPIVDLVNQHFGAPAVKWGKEDYFNAPSS